MISKRAFDWTVSTIMGALTFLAATSGKWFAVASGVGFLFRELDSLPMQIGTAVLVGGTALLVVSKMSVWIPQLEDRVEENV